MGIGLAIIRPGNDDAFALVLPEVNTATMQMFLDRFAASLAAEVHAILLLDRPGWHVTKRLRVPPKLGLVFQPPYSPELNPIERVWLFLRARFLSHRVFANPRAVVRELLQSFTASVPPRSAPSFSPIILTSERCGFNRIGITSRCGERVRCILRNDYVERRAAS